MPYLRLLSPDGAGLRRNPQLSVLAHSLFPNDFNKATEWLSAATANHYSSALALLSKYGYEEEADELREMGILPASVVERLFESNRSMKRVFSDGLDRWSPGRLAGVILLVRLKCAIHHPEHSQLFKTVVLLEEFLPQIYNSPSSASESTLNHAWAEFKTVSHLHLAAWWSDEEQLQLGLSVPFEQFFNYCVTSHDIETFWEALGLAETFRLLAEEHRIVKAEDTWKCPKKIPLPERSVEIQPLQERYLKFLNQLFPGSVSR